MHAFKEVDRIDRTDRSNGIGRIGRIDGIGREPLRLIIGQGYTLLCLQGAVWLTCESEDRTEAARDIVLARGERFEAERTVTVIVSAIRRRPARIALTLRNTEIGTIAENDPADLRQWPAALPYRNVLAEAELREPVRQKPALSGSDSTGTRQAVDRI